MSPSPDADPVAGVPAGLQIPADRNGPVFAEPWEARIFALVIDLNARGTFTWKEFQSLLVEEIRRSEQTDHGRPYYLNWLIAAERLFAGKGLILTKDVDAEVERLRPDDRTIRLR